MKTPHPLIIAAFIPFILAIIYLSKYQSLVEETSSLADEHCIEINPLITDRKEKFISAIKAVVDNPDAFSGNYEQYQSASKRYLERESGWLMREKALLNRWDFKLFVDPMIQEAGMWEYRMYKADFDGTDLLLKASYEKNEEIQEQLVKKAEVARKEFEKSKYEYNKMWEERPTPNPLDFKNYFIKIPESKCPPENLNIPDVEKELEI